MAEPSPSIVSSVWRAGIFADTVVFCTGGAGTICSAQVRALVALGGNACIVGRNVAKTEAMAADIATARSGAVVLGLGDVDVRSYDSLCAAAARCVDVLGAIDYVIAGAAGNFLAPITGLSTNAFKAVMDIDVLGSYNTLKATLPHLLASAAAHPNAAARARTGGRIVFVSATLHYVGHPLQAHVMAAKAGVDALSSSVCLEFGPRGVTSNVIAPGPIAGTEGLQRLYGRKDGRDEQDALSRATVPLGRFGSVKEIADATVYLFSDAGSYVNGATLVVDGGSWRAPQALGTDGATRYPDVVLKGTIPGGVKGGGIAEKARL